MNTKRKKMLAWADSATLATGFGKITNYVLQAAVRECGYEVDQVGVSYFGEFYDREEFPWQISCASARDVRDSSGKGLVLHSIKNGGYDCVWIQMDIQHFLGISKSLREIRENFQKSGKPFPKIIYHFPIDVESLRGEPLDCDLCDVIVPYTNFGKDRILEEYPDAKKKIEVIECGYDPKTVLPLSEESRKLYRKSYFNIVDDDTFLILNVNRNSPRKMLPHVLKIYSEFRKEVPNSKLYLHTDPNDKASGIKLEAATKELQLELKTEVQFPEDFSVVKPKPVATLTAIYNASDCFFTAAFGEGWGLTHTDAMAVGVPVVAPINTVFPEQLGDGERGYLYPCRESIWFHQTGYRPVPRIEDALHALRVAHKDFTELRKKGVSAERARKIEAARVWMQERTIEKISRKWVELFRRVDP